MRDWLAIARSLDDAEPGIRPEAENRAPSCSETSESSETPSFEAFDRFGTPPLSVSAPPASPYAHGLVGEWQRAFAGLSPDREPCPAFRNWPGVYRSARSFLEHYGEAAAALRWTDLELFGVHPKVGTIRVDCSGALMVSRGSPVVSVTAGEVAFDSGLIFRRSIQPPIGLAIPVWEFVL